MATTEVGDLQTLWRTKLSQLHALAVSIATERKRGNEAGVQAMRPVFVSLVNDINGIAAQLKVQDAGLDWVGKFLLDLDSGVKTIVSIPNDLLNLSKLKPLIWAGIALLALHYVSPLFRAFEARHRK